MQTAMIDRRRFLAALSALAVTAPSLAACMSREIARAPDRRWPAVQALLDRMVAEAKVAGHVAGLGYGGGEMQFARAGRIAIDPAAPIADENSIWRIYSMSKPVTGIAAFIAIDEGRIELDQPVSDVLAGFRTLKVAIDPKKGLEGRPLQTPITMRHLLTHTAGLGYSIGANNAVNTAYSMAGITPAGTPSLSNIPGFGSPPGAKPQAVGLAQMVERLVELPLLQEPGTEWTYSIGLDVMGAVLDRVGGSTFERYLEERLFDPLDMRSTGFQISERDTGRISTLYALSPKGLVPVDKGATSDWLKPQGLPSGGGGLVSTARDFARFGEMLLGDGALGRVRVMKAETARLAMSNLLPAGVSTDMGGHGAGGRVVLAGNGDSESRFGSPGSFGWGGAAGTLWSVDPGKKTQMVYMVQHFPSDAYKTADLLSAAIKADLAA